MRMLLTRFIPLALGVGLIAAALALAFPLVVAAHEEQTLREPGTDLRSCVRIDYEKFTATGSELVLTTRYTNECDTDLSGGRMRIVAQDRDGALIEDGWSQIPALPAGASRTDDTSFQQDLTAVAWLAHDHLLIWQG